MALLIALYDKCVSRGMAARAAAATVTHTVATAAPLCLSLTVALVTSSSSPCSSNKHYLMHSIILLALTSLT
jgi:hypothetical protein